MRTPKAKRLPDKNNNWSANMLTVIYGPFGVGKTSIIRRLHELHGCRIVTTFTTRAQRSGETEKRSVTKELFASMVSNAEVLFPSEFDGNWYGTSAADLSQAIDENQHWLIDYALKHRTLLNAPHLPVIILPQSESQLRQQLIGAGRQHRVSDAINALRNDYNTADLTTLAAATVVNIPNQLSHTVTSIWRLMENVHPKAD